MIPSLRRRCALVLAGLLGVLAGLVATAGPAAAHAELVAASPARGARLEVAPTQVTLRFSEAVTATGHAVQVTGPDGAVVDTGPPRSGAGGAEVTVALRPDLPPGSYTVTWRVVSDDSHPLSGAYAFGVGADAGQAAAGGTGGSRLVGVLHGAAQLVVYAGLATLLGGVAFLLLLWPAGLLLRRARLLVAASSVVLAAATVGLLLLEGPYATGRGLGASLDPTALSDTLGTRLGKLLLVRLLLLALALPALLRLCRPGGRAPGAPGLGTDLLGLGVTTLLTLSLAQHASVGRQVPVAVASDTLHLAAMCVWVGGLVLLAVLLVRPAAGTAAALAPVLPRWSRLAVAAVAVLTVTGSYQSWREVGTLPALPGTAYGRLLLVKLGAFVVLLALGDLARRRVRRTGRRARPVAHAVGDLAAVAPPTAAAPELGALRRGVLVEVAVAAAVLGLAATLVNAPPARTAYPDPLSTGFDAVGLDPGSVVRVRVELDRTTSGPATVTVTTSDRAARPVAGTVDGLLEDTARRTPPQRFALTARGPGRSEGHVDVPEAGRWRLTLQVRAADGAAYAGSTDYDVR